MCLISEGEEEERGRRRETVRGGERRRGKVEERGWGDEVNERACVCVCGGVGGL